MEPDLYQGLKNQIGAAIPSVLGVCLRAPPLGDGCLLRSGIPTHTYHVPILLGEKSSDPLPPPPSPRADTARPRCFSRSVTLAWLVLNTTVPQRWAGWCSRPSPIVISGFHFSPTRLALFWVLFRGGVYFW